MIKNDLKNTMGILREKNINKKSLLWMIIKRNLRWAYLKNNKWLPINIFGYKMLLDLRREGIDFSESSIVKQLALDKKREFESTKIMQKTLSKNDIVLDIGANIGYYALMGATVAKKVYALEPVKVNCVELERNIALNKFNNIDVFPWAAGDENKDIFIKWSKFPNRCSTSDSGGNENVKMVTVDSFIENRDVPTLIKMDIEGAEWIVLKGMKKLLESSEKLKMFIEIHPEQIREYGGSAKEVFEMLGKYGFELDCIVLYDRNIRSKLKQTEVIEVSISDIIKNNELMEGTEAIEAWFRR